MLMIFKKCKTNMEGLNSVMGLFGCINKDDLDKSSSNNDDGRSASGPHGMHAADCAFPCEAEQQIHSDPPAEEGQQGPLEEQWIN